MIYREKGDGGEATENVPVEAEMRNQFSLTEDEVVKLAEWASIIEDHYSEEAGYYKPMDMEWAKDGESGDLFIVQARPETVVSRREAGVMRRSILEKTGPVLAEGMAVGELIGSGKAAVIKSTENIKDFQEGMVLVTEVTDPDWVPIMKIASAIVTDVGGRVCHAAIISRELGIPCVVGTGKGSQAIANGQDITVSCAGGVKGLIYEGILPFKEETIRLDELEMPKLPLLYHQSDPDRAFPDSRYPNAGVGLLRVDEVIRDEVKVHPLACLEYPSEASGEIDAVSAGYPDKKAYFVSRVSQSIGRITASAHPNPVRVLLSDATGAEMAKLIGGALHPDSHEDENPMLGTRGAGRYIDFDYEEAFALEMQALAKVRGEMGQDNMHLILPACQTPAEAADIASVLSGNGLGRGDGLEHHLLCRTPAQLLCLDTFAEAIDGFLFSVSDLARLIQGIDPASVLAGEYYSEKHPAVISLLDTGLELAQRLGKPAGLVNIAPGNIKSFAESGLFKKAGYLALRPDVLPQARQTLIDAGV